MFDGHGGFAAAEYLQQNLYKIYTRVLDQKSVQSNLEMSQDLPGEPRWWAPRPSWDSPSATADAAAAQPWMLTGVRHAAPAGSHR